MQNNDEATEPKNARVLMSKKRMPSLVMYYESYQTLCNEYR
jgi:hypothetical protein